MTTLKTVEEVVPEMTKHTMWRDNDHKILEERLTEIITQDRASIHTSLVAAVEGLKRKHYEDTAFMKHRNDFNDAYNEVVDDTLTIINSIFKE